MNFTTSMNILSMNCQSLHAKFDYVGLLIDKFKNNNCALQVVCLQESWFSADTDLSLYMIPGYHLISTGRYASNHVGLVIYLNTNWDYKVKSDDTVSKLSERQIVEIIDPNNKLRKKIIVGNIDLPIIHSTILIHLWQSLIALCLNIMPILKTHICVEITMWIY